MHTATKSLTEQRAPLSLPMQTEPAEDGGHTGALQPIDKANILAVVDKLPDLALSDMRQIQVRCMT